ncbi:MAG TPA: PEGA domain-containing protein, partial [Polyangiaceae bacterium]|nr:PEGA domain-containing protein [Polyangiaceae bacterium]
ETEILLDGKKIGTTPISAHKVTPGTHDVTFVDERNGNRTMTVTIAAGEAKTVKSDLPPQIREQKAPDDGKK